MGKPNTTRQIRERREKITILMSHGYSPDHIIDELKISRMTFNRDMHYINEMNEKGLFEMAKKSFSTMYSNCNDGMNEILYECWKIYKNVDNDPEITLPIKMAALKLAADIQDKKFAMFQNCPTVMGLKRLHDRVDELRRFVFEDSNSFGTRFVPSKDLDSNANTNANTNINLDDLGKP